MTIAPMEIANKYYYFWQRKVARKKLKSPGESPSFMRGEKVIKTIEKLRKLRYERIGKLFC